MKKAILYPLAFQATASPELFGRGDLYSNTSEVAEHIGKGGLSFPLKKRLGCFIYQFISRHVKTLFSVLCCFLLINAEAQFTVNTISVSPAQTGTLTYGTGGSVTYTLSLGEISGSNTTTNFSLNWTPPAGVSFSPPSATLMGASQTVTLTLTSTGSTPAGNYSFTVTSSDGTNTVTSGSASFIIDPKGLTITANNQNKTYGATLALGTTLFGVSGLVNGDAVSNVVLNSAGAVNTANAGGYPITPSGATGTGLSNYTITYIDGSLTVSQAPVTITANDLSKPYGAALSGGTGSTAFTISPLSLPNGETIGSVTISYGSGASAGASAGNYPDAVVPSAAAGGTFNPANYSITYVAGDITVTNTNTSIEIISNLSPACSGTNVTFLATISSVLSNATGTVEFFNDGTSLGTVAVASNQASKSLTSLPVGLRNITAIYSGDANNNGSTSPVLVQEIKANPTAAVAGPNQSACGVSVVTLAANSPAVGTGKWTVATGSGGSFNDDTNPAATFSGVIGNSYTLRWIISNNPCVASTSDVLVTLNATPTVVTPASPSYCNNGISSAINFTGTGTSYTWTNNQTSIGLGAGGTGSIPSFTVINTGTTNVTANLTVTPSANGCIGTAAVFTITAKPRPVVTANPATQVVCSGSTISTINLTSNIAGSAINWSRDNVAGITGSGGVAGFGPVSASSITGSFANSLAAPGTVGFHATATINGCSSASQTDFTVTINPVTTVNNISNQTVCSGANTAAITFTSPNANGYRWSNSNASIGLGLGPVTAAGIGSFTATNSGLTPTSGIVTVTPTYTGGSVTCDGTPKTFTLTVNPIPTMNSGSTGSLCSGSVFSYSPTTSATGITASYAWTRAAVATVNSNAGSSGTGNVNEALTITSSTGSSKTVTYQYTVSGTNNGVTCTNTTPFNIVVTINPVPKLTLTPSANQSICSGSSINPVTISDTRLTGTTFSWNRSNISLITGIPSGTQTSNPIAGTLTVTDNAIHTSTFTITASNSGCSSIDSFKVQVNPPIANNSIVASQVSSVTFCGLTKQVTITSNPTPTGGAGNGTYKYDWLSSTPSDGPYSQVKTDTPTLITLVGTSDTYFKRITSSGGCKDTSIAYIIPTASGDPSYIVGSCTGGSGKDIWVIASYAGANYTLQRDISGVWTDQGTPKVGDGDSLNFPDNKTVGTYRVVASIPSPSCTQVVTGTVTISAGEIPPAPSGSYASPSTICAGTSTNLFGGVPAGSAVYWYDVASGGTTLTPTPVNSGSSFTVSPVTTTTYYAKAVITATGCKSSNRDAVPVTVNPSPVMTSSSLLGVCSGSSVSLAFANNVAVAATYNWVATANGNITGESTTPVTNGTLNDVLSSSILTTDTVTYTVTPTVTATGCIGAPQTVKVEVDPKPIITSPQTFTVCSLDSFYLAPVHGGGNTVPTSPVTQYTWSSPTGTGFSGGMAGTGSKIAGKLTNNTTSPVTASYTVTASGGACTGSTFTAIVTLNPTPVITDQAVAVCNGSFSIPPFTGSNSVPANTTYSWPAPTGSNISGMSPGTNQSSVSGTLVNTSSPTVPKVATYTVTPTGPAGMGGCVGTPFTVLATVNPIPAAAISGNTTVCPGSTANITFTGSNGTPPYTFTYNINGAGPNTVSTTGGNSSVTVSANTSTPGTYTYSLTYVSDALSSCNVIQGGNAVVVVTQPPVILPANQSIRACSGSLSSVGPVDGFPTAATIVPPGTTYSWPVPVLPLGVTGASPGTNQPDFSQTLINNTGTVQQVFYTVTPSNANGCPGTPFTVTLALDPALPANSAIWTGSQNADWCNPWNWSCGFIPNSLSIDAIIPSGTPNQPAITGTCNATVHNLDLQGSATLNLATGRGLTVYGEFVTTSNPNRFTLNGLVTFAGGNQQIPGFVYNGLSVTGGGIKTLAGPATVNGNLSLVNGIIVTSSANMLTAGVSANVSNGSDQSYIQGPLTRQTNSTNTYTFPVGSNGDLRNAYVIPSTNTLSSYTIYYHNGMPTIGSVLDANLAGIQINEYWNFAKNSGVDAIIGMDYVNPNGLGAGATTTDWSGGVNPCGNCNVAVAYGNASNNWYFTGGFSGGFGANEATYWQSNNTVFSRLQSTYGQFSFGYAYAVILPVKLLQFTGKLQGNVSQLDWKYTNGTEVASTELQHSVDGNHFVKLSVFAGGDDDYKYYHSNLKGGQHYYRLMIKDKAGKITYSNTVLLIVGSDITVIKGIRPTMVHNEAYIAIHSVKSQAVQAILFDLAGRKVAEYRGNLVEGENNFRIEAMKLAKGFYTAHVVTNDGAQANLRFIKE